MAWSSRNTEMHLVLSVQTWLSAELAEERLLLSVLQKPLTSNPFGKIRGAWCWKLLCSFVNHRRQRSPRCPRRGKRLSGALCVFHVFFPPSHGKSPHSEVTVAAVFALASRWGSFHKLLLPTGGLTPPTPTPGPPLSTPDERTSCTNSRGWAYVGDFTERVRELPDRTSSPLLVTFSCSSVHFGSDPESTCMQPWLGGLLSWAFSSPFISAAPSSPGQPWTPATTTRGLRAAACPSSRTWPSIAPWWYRTRAAPRLRSTACRRGQRAPATSAMQRTRSGATTPPSWRTSTGTRRAPGGRANPCISASSTRIPSTSPCTWVRVQPERTLCAACIAHVGVSWCYILFTCAQRLLYPGIEHKEQFCFESRLFLKKGFHSFLHTN